MNPPSQLDGSQVLYWAWSGDKPFGNMNYTDGSVASEIYGFAICINAGTILRFSCDHDWQVQNDMDFPTIEEAMKAEYRQYQNQPTIWNKFDDTDIEALVEASQKVEFYREIGERRVIQKIVSHLQQKKCNGMWVHSVAKDTWILSIQKKDIAIASEIAKQNVPQFGTNQVMQARMVLTSRIRPTANTFQYDPIF